MRIQVRSRGVYARPHRFLNTYTFVLEPDFYRGFIRVSASERSHVSSPGFIERGGSEHPRIDTRSLTNSLTHGPKKGEVKP